jgi:hypothetical protein
VPTVASVYRRLPSLNAVRSFDAAARQQAYYIVHAPGAGRTRKIRLVKEWLLEEVQLMDSKHQ